MKIWKIVSGILSILISLFVVFQSFFAGAYNILTGNGQSSGTAGILVAIMLLTGGVVSIAASGGGRGGDTALAFLFSLGALIGFFGAGNYTDLYIWASWCLLCGVLAMVDFVRIGRCKDEKKVSVSAHPTAAAGKRATTFQDIILETDPKKRDAAIDAMPEKQAKSYLKQTLNVLVPRQAAGSSDDNDGIIKALIVVMAVIGIFVVGVIFIGIFTSTSGRDKTVSSAPPAASNIVIESAPVQETPEQSQAAAQPQPFGAGTLGDYYVEIQSAFIADDYEGNPAIIVTYAWTNNSDRTANALTVLSEKAFQNGVQIDRAVVYSSDTPGYESNTSSRDLRPGATAEVQCAFSFQDWTTPVEFELSELISFSEETVTVNLDPSTLNVVE